MYLFFDQPLILLALIALPFLLLMGIDWEANRKPKTISRKKTKELVRKAVKSNEMPTQFRRYNF